MKTREEIKASIRCKSEARVAERVRRRRAVMAAVCVVPVMAAAGLWQLHGRWARSDDNVLNMGAAPTEDDYAGGVVEGGVEIGADEKKFSQEPESTNEIYCAQNDTYAAPDSMKIYTLTNTETAGLSEVKSKEISLSAENEGEREMIRQMSDWLSALATKPTAGRADNGGITYVVERTYGGNVTAVYVQGDRIKFGEGEWLAFSGEDRATFDRIMWEIGRNDEKFERDRYQ